MNYRGGVNKEVTMPEYISKGGNWKVVVTKETPKSTEVEISAEVIAEDETITYNEELDINRDGAVDDKDATIAGKVLNAIKSKKSKKKDKSS